MQDNKMKALRLFSAVSLAVCLAASCIVSDAGSSYAATSSLKWTRITIPDTQGMQLAPYTDVGAMAVSLDGRTLFAAVHNEPTNPVPNVWKLLKSMDGAFSWLDTGLSDAMAAIVDTSDIVAVKLSPDWNTDGFIFVATQNSVYYSDDSGKTFDDLAPVPGTELITSLDLALDSSSKIVVAVGTADPTPALGGDVYIFNLGAWGPQGVGTYDVLAVGLSPSYATDQTVIAVVTDGTKTMVRTKRSTGGWGGTIPDATFKDQDVNNFGSYRACIGFPSDYNAVTQTGSVLICFVGLCAAGPLGPLGDVFRIQGGWLSVSNAVDLNVRGNVSAVDPSETNIWSIAVSGTVSNRIIIAGTEDLNLSASPAGQFLVYASFTVTGGWEPSSSDYLSYKQPTGEREATVVLATSVAYVGTCGDQSAVSAASDAMGLGFDSWNQRGLIDTAIDEITDMSPSAEYFSDGTIFITTYNTSTDVASLWRTQTEGGTWERLYCSTLTINVTTLSPTCVFNMVRLAGSAVVVAGGRSVIHSVDDGATFSFDPWNAAIGNTLEDITAFAVEDASTYYAGDASGGVWKWTDDSGMWTLPSDSEILPSEKVVDLVLTSDGDIYAGTDQGGVYTANASDFAFSSVGPGGSQPGAPGDIVHVTPDLYDGSYVYAGIRGGASTQGIWRLYKGDPEAVWEHIADGTVVGDISSLACDEKYGVLYAISSSDGKGYRWVKPSSEEVAQPDEIDNGLNIPAGASVRRGLKLVSEPIFLFAVGGVSGSLFPYTGIWTTSDEMVKMKLLTPEAGASDEGTILEDEASLGRARVELRWIGVTGAKSYEVQVTFDEAMDSPADVVYYNNETQYTSGTVKVVYLWLGTRYYWRVRVVAPYMSQWSDTRSFSTPLGPAPSIPGLVYPEAGQKNVMLRPSLQWNSSIAATGYELILTANCDWGNPVLNLSGGSKLGLETAYRLTFDLAKNTSYCWKVRGVNDITHSSWSDAGTFTTGFTAGAENSGVPVWIWVIIALATVFILSILVLITQSRRF